MSERLQSFFTNRETVSELPKIEPGQFDVKIIFQLINTERNKSLLEDMPHRELEDLSIIYRAFVGNKDDVIGSITITDSIAESLKLTEEEALCTGI